VVNRGSTDDDLALLSFYERARPDVVEIFRCTRERFGAAPMSRVVDHPQIAELAQRHGWIHLGGPMLGDVGPNRARVWVRTLRPARVTVQVETAHGRQVFGPVEANEETDCTAVVRITDLSPDGEFPYQVFVDGQPIPQPPGATIRTLPDSRRPARVRIVIGADFHKSGLQNPRLFHQILQRRPHAVLLLGDLAAGDRNHCVGLHRSDYLLRDLSFPWRELVARVPVYAVWDDHDYFNNDRSGIPPGCTDAHRRAVRQVWMENWNNPAYGSDDAGGIYFRTRIGPCDVVMLDSRYFRDPNIPLDPNEVSAPQENSKPISPRFLGLEQSRWLAEQLRECRGPFLLLSCGTMWTDWVSKGKDSWGVWDPAGRERLFRWLDRAGWTTLLVSGDRHGARGFRIPRPTGREFYEFNSALLGGHPGPAAWVQDCPDQMFGFVETIAFGELELDSTTSPHTATWRLIHEDGAELARVTIE
jgi:alkaline phosphatase D